MGERIFDTTNTTENILTQSFNLNEATNIILKSLQVEIHRMRVMVILSFLSNILVICSTILDRLYR